MIMKKTSLKRLSLIYLLFFIFQCSLPVMGQLMFQKVVSGGYAYDAHKVVKGSGYVFGGITNNTPTAGIRNSYVVRTDVNGDTLWTSAWTGVAGSCDQQYINDLCPLSDGGVIANGGKGICGDTTKGGSIVRLDKNGNIKWAKSFWIGCDPYPCIQSSDGNFVTGGYISNGGYTQPKDAYLTKLDSATGDTIWSKRIGGAGTVDWFYHILQTPDGGYLAAGKTNSFGQGGLDVYLVKTNAKGNVMWSKTYGTAALDEIAWGHCLQLTSDGGYIISGTGGGGVNGTGTQSAEGLFLLKIDSLGNMAWARYYAGQEAHAVRQTADKGYIILADAYTGPPLYQGDVVLIKTDSLGVIQWSKAYGGPQDEQGLVLEVAPDGGYVAGGTTLSFGGGLYIVKTDANGNSGCNEKIFAVTSSVAPFIMANAASIESKGPNTFSYPYLFARGGTIVDLCNTVGIKEQPNRSELGELTVFPNPSNGILTVQSSNELGLITIFNSLGEIIYSKNVIDAIQQIDLSACATGIYFLKSPNSYIKFIKE
jgi:hypothetical protein